MNEWSIQVKNYRSFSDSNPLNLTIKKGFTAFVGPNNAGKSTVLKFFYEFKSIIRSLSSNLDAILNPKIGLTANFDLPVQDNYAVFHKYNDRPISVKISVEDVQLYFDIPKNEGSNPPISNVFLDVDGVRYIDPSSISMGDVEKIKYQKKRLNPLREVLKSFDKVLYIPAFRNAINIGDANNKYFAIPVGSGFIKTWNEWKNGHSTQERESSLQVEKDIKDVLGYSEFAINVSKDLSAILLVINGKNYTMHEVGAGIMQFVIVFVLAALRKPDYILIDEPELNLHPALQQKFLTKLAHYAKNGVLFATHSVGLARAVSDDIYTLTMVDNVSRIDIFGKGNNFSEMLGEMGFSTWNDIGFEKILLVEGATDVCLFQELLRELKKDVKVAIISLGGSDMINGNRARELSEIQRIKKEIHCWIDSEKDNASSDIPKDRKEFVDNCKNLGIEVTVSERRATDNYLTESAIQKVKGKKYRALGPYDNIKKSTASWGKNESWLIAREMKSDDIKETDLGKFLLEL